MLEKRTKFRVEVGRRVRLLREHLGLDQNELGKIIGIEGNAVSMIEAGIRGLDPERATRLRSVSGATLDWLYADQAGGLGRDLLKPLTTPRAVPDAGHKERKRAKG